MSAKVNSSKGAKAITTNSRWAAWVKFFGLAAHRAEGTKMQGKTPDSHYDDLVCFLKHHPLSDGATESDSQIADTAFMMLFFHEKTGNVKTWASWERSLPEISKDRCAKRIYALIKSGHLFWKAGQAHQGDLSTDAGKFNTNCLKNVGADLKCYAYVTLSLAPPTAEDILKKEWAASLAIDDTCFNNHTAAQRTFRKKTLNKTQEYNEAWAEAKRASKLGFLDVDGKVVDPIGELYSMTEIGQLSATLHKAATDKAAAT